MFALVAALLLSDAAAVDKESNIIQQLLARREKVRELTGRPEPMPRAPPAQLERRARLSEDEREIMTKQIMQAISGMLWVWGVKVQSSSSLIAAFDCLLDQ